jgi:hypothetical protein
VRQCLSDVYGHLSCELSLLVYKDRGIAQNSLAGRRPTQREVDVLGAQLAAGEHFIAASTSRVCEAATRLRVWQRRARNGVLAKASGNPSANISH